MAHLVESARRPPDPTRPNEPGADGNSDAGEDHHQATRIG